MTPQLPVPATGDDTWSRLPEGKRRVAQHRMLLVKPVLDLMAEGIKLTPAIEHLLARIASGQASAAVVQAALTLGRGGKSVSPGTLHRWVADHQSGGLAALAYGQTVLARAGQAAGFEWNS